ncbi:MAG TPA: hypothetical protein DIV40_05920 [Clostridiales bacterium]|nr:hypothetical protein [Clostridiales bacterium]
MKSKTVKILNIDSSSKMAIEVVDDMKFSELVQAWGFLTGFIFDICEGQDEGTKALRSNDKQLRTECKRIFYPVFKERAAYLMQRNESDNSS